MTQEEVLDDVRRRIAPIRTAFATGHLQMAMAPRRHTGIVHFECRGKGYDVATIAGVPQSVTSRPHPADWAVVVDDMDLIVPLQPPRGLSTLARCSLRFGSGLWPHPMEYERQHWQPDYFPERTTNALLYFYCESHGSPVGSLAWAMLLNEGVPEYLGDAPNPPDDMPTLAMGISWAKYHEYRRGRAHQLSTTDGAWIDGNWKDLLVLHGLYDAEGYARVWAGYPELPDSLSDYCWALAEAAKLPEASPTRDAAGPAVAESKTRAL